MPWMFQFDQRRLLMTLTILAVLVLAAAVATAVAVVAPDASLTPSVVAGWMWRPEGWMW